MIDFGGPGPSQETYSLYILNGRGELQRRVTDFRDRKAALGGAAALLGKWTGCVALVVAARAGVWTSCHAYTAKDCRRFAPVSRRPMRRNVSMDVRSLYACAAVAGGA